MPLKASGCISWRESIIKAIETYQYKTERVKTDHAWLKLGNCLQVWSNCQRREFPGTMGIGGLKKNHLIVITVALNLFGSKTACQRMSVTARSIQSRSWSHIDWKVSRDLCAAGLTSRPQRSSITRISLDTASRVLATSTVEFFSSFTQNHSITSIQLFKLVKSITQRDMSTPISNRLFLKAELKWSVCRCLTDLH